VLILNDFKSFVSEVLILNDFKSLFPEVLILKDFKSMSANEIGEIIKISEVLIPQELTCEFRTNGWN
jgi:hypothetical protein